MEVCRIFYSWQSDVNESRNFIGDCLKRLPSKLKELSIIEVARDTEGYAGSPNIGDTIFNRIDSCDIFVADVTIINKEYTGRKTPNPNVLIELGYAIKALGWDRIILLYDEDFGNVDELPFDINHQRMTKYSLKEESKPSTREKIISNFRATIEILKDQGLLHGGQPNIISARKELSKTILTAMQKIFEFYNDRDVLEKEDWNTEFFIITDSQIELLNLIKDILSDDQHYALGRLLHNLKMSGTGSADEDGWEFAEKVIQKYFEPLHREFAKEIGPVSLEQVLTKEFIELYNSVAGEESFVYSAERVVDRRLLFKVDGQTQEAYDQSGNLVCKGEINLDGFTGFKCTTRYKGEFMNSLYHGEGIEFTNYFNRLFVKCGEIRREGKWRDGVFLEGKIYDAVIYLTDSDEYELLDGDKANEIMTVDSDSFRWMSESWGWKEDQSQRYYFADITYENNEFYILDKTVVSFRERYASMIDDEV